MKKKRRINKGRGVLIRFEDTVDIANAILWASFAIRRCAIEYARSGFPCLAMDRYKQWKKLNEAYGIVGEASCTLGSWRRVGWR